jgi:hypothetical protein
MSFDFIFEFEYFYYAAASISQSANVLDTVLFKKVGGGRDGGSVVSAQRGLLYK